MPPGASISVEENGTLIIDEGTITDIENKTWQGIQLDGDYTKTQWPESGIYHHGRLITKNGAVEQATYVWKDETNVDWSTTTGSARWNHIWGKKLFSNLSQGFLAVHVSLSSYLKANKLAMWCCLKPWYLKNW